jgi:uncharacterized protein YegP (UPF0339 family)
LGSNGLTTAQAATRLVARSSRVTLLCSRFRSKTSRVVHLKAPNGEIIAASQGYETKANAEKGIEAIKTHAPGAKVEDHSET